MAQYFLAPHVHLCVTDDHVVLLDLKRDKYVGVGASQMDALAQAVTGWPSSESLGLRAAAVQPASAGALISKLVATGVLTMDPAAGKPAIPLVLPRPDTTLTVADFDTRPRVTLVDVARFLRACASAKLALKWRAIDSVVSRVRARKLRGLAATPPVAPAAARARVEVFLHLRPLVFGSKNQCLFDSLALIEFLAAGGLYPSWVFGVQTGPFAAHCWVQQEAVIFNDTPDHVRRFTPILAV